MSAKQSVLEVVQKFALQEFSYISIILEHRLNNLCICFIFVATNPFNPFVDIKLRKYFLEIRFGRAASQYV